MIIFNWLLIPELLVLFCIVEVITYFFPGPLDGPSGQWVKIAICVFGGGVCDAIGLRGRIFFMPVWVVGLLIAVATAFDTWGWVGMVVGGGVLVGSLVVLAYYGDRVEWKAAPPALEAATTLLDTRFTTAELSEQLERALYIPMRNYTSEVCTHNRRVVRLLSELGTDRLSAEDRDALETFDELLMAGEVSATAIQIDADLSNRVKAARDGLFPSSE